MAKTLYLHIGTQKTGTTTIQMFMHSQSEILAEYGIAYPSFPYKFPKVSPSRNASFIYRYVMNEDGSRDKAQKEARFIDCMDRVHKLFGTYDTVVLSDESLWTKLYTNVGLLEKVMEDSKKNGYILKLIVYLRRQDQFIESLWNQSIKNMHLSTKATIEKYIDSRINDLKYYEKMDYFAGVVGDENIIVKRFADTSKNGLLQDFLQEIGVHPEGIAEEAHSKNAGLYGNTVRLKQLINQIESLTYTEQRFFAKSLLLCSAVSKENYSCSEFSEEERRAFMSGYEKENALLAERFIGDGRPLFSDDYSGPPKREDMNPELINDIVRSAAATDLLLYRENQVLSEKVRVLSEKVRVQEKQVASLERRTDHIRHPMKAVLSKIKRRISR